MTFPFGQTVTVWIEDRSRVGDTIKTDEREVRGCAVAPRSLPGASPETVGARITVTTGITLYTPPHSGLTSKHRVRLEDGTLWEVEGDPGRWKSPFTGWYPGDQVELQRVTG